MTKITDTTSYPAMYCRVTDRQKTDNLGRFTAEYYVVLRPGGWPLVCGPYGAAGQPKTRSVIFSSEQALQRFGYERCLAREEY